MACNTNTARISRRIRLEIARDYIKRKKQWDLPGDARVIIEDLIKLVEELDSIPEKE